MSKAAKTSNSQKLSESLKSKSEDSSKGKTHPDSKTGKVDGKSSSTAHVKNDASTPSVQRAQKTGNTSPKKARSPSLTPNGNSSPSKAAGRQDASKKSPSPTPGALSPTAAAKSPTRAAAARRSSVAGRGSEAAAAGGEAKAKPVIKGKRVAGGYWDGAQRACKAHGRGTYHHDNGDVYTGQCKVWPLRSSRAGRTYYRSMGVLEKSAQMQKVHR
jgi:hypothetical protein